MKFKSNKITCIIMSTIILFSNVISVQAENTSLKINKDETVYTTLNHDGSVQNINLVNRLFNIEDTTTIDFGTYLEVNPLRKAELLEISNNKIIWDTSDYISNDFYYEGIIEKELPIIVDINYFFNGDKVEASQLAGKTGEIKITFNVNQNPECDEAYKDIFMTQIQLMLDLDSTKILSSVNSVNTVTGKYSTLAYTVLPNEDKTFELVLDSKNFELQPINIALVSTEMNLESLDELIDGLDDMKDGMTELTDGTKKLQNGMVDLVSGVDDLNNGVEELSNGASDLSSGMGDYENGLLEFKTGIDSIASGVTDTTNGLNNINEQSSMLEDGYTKLYSGLEELVDGHAQLTLIANNLLNSDDPNLQALAEGIISENKALEELTIGFEMSNQGLNAYTTGLNNLTSGINSLNEGMSALPSGMEGLVTGYGKLYDGYKSINKGLFETKNGINEMYNKIDTLPSDVTKLVDGQEKIADGVGELNEKLSESLLDTDNKKVLSFADSNIAIHSLQFMMKTPDIKIENSLNDSSNDIREDDKPWYENIWNKLTALFH
ncbi:hypothetical protein [Oceanirhabdus seepicola]|uniref:X-X-X-Leu-X-X-Gly heptad repeat-containing protein n=1 Tax=Oceanirhabdus seepicola TaxID=2828781 RepID=A0A9J6NVB4_9CLOT|nr:hypothetical protein [Oceanirhabdus seepicola]MCM1988203.1 hypothetical protein [Oceanirhabdus seepicola]